MDACPYREGDSCKVSAEWAGLPVVNVTDAACEVCSTCDKPRQLNRVTASLGASMARRTQHPRYDEIQRAALPHISSVSVAEKASRYLTKSASWVASGAPIRTDEETERTFAICQGCDHYKDGSCDVCGCHVGTGSALNHKNRRATEHCPIGKW